MGSECRGACGDQRNRAFSIYLLDRFGRPGARLEIRARGDGDAVDFARRMARVHAVEVWSGARRVARLRPLRTVRRVRLELASQEARLYADAWGAVG